MGRHARSSFVAVGLVVLAAVGVAGGERQAEAAAKRPVRITIFTPDPTCIGVQAHEVVLSKASPTAAVRAVVKSKELSDLPLQKPKVHVERGAARVELALERGSKRSLKDLTECERIALLSGIKHTLVDNPRWSIGNVVFTDHGMLLAM